MSFRMTSFASPFVLAIATISLFVSYAAAANPGSTYVTATVTLANTSKTDSVYVRLSSGNGQTLWTGTIPRNTTLPPMKLPALRSNDWVGAQVGDSQYSHFASEATHPYNNMLINLNPCHSSSHWCIKFK